MSDSRLEKFIYAICSMDVSDLPVPLSRIEKLWNCLITGETPDFEPLSRNEKYLMAMLDRYDISNLPAPMSRGEKLLYKIAVGETDLSDVPGYLSRYEELLKYLIENGENSEDDFEYVLYTLNQSLHTLYLTAEKPVKKAIVYGDTLVNTLQESSSLSVTPMGEAIDTQQATITGTANGVIKSAILKGNTLVNVLTEGQQNITTDKGHIDYFIGQNLKANTVYTAIFQAETEAVHLRVGITQSQGTWNSNNMAYTNGYNKVLLTTTVETAYSLRIRHNDEGSKAITVSNVMLIEGDHTNVDIPYFEGMQSVKLPVLTTTGKNLADFSKNLTVPFGKKEISNNQLRLYSENAPHIWNMITKYNFHCEVGENISIQFKINKNKNENERFSASVYDGNALKKTTSLNPGTVNGECKVSFVATTNNIRIEICPTYGNDYRLPYDVTIYDFQIEKGDMTQYEPHKSNILTVNEPIELRGIGEGSNRVEDELNCFTGEVTERIGEIVLNGSENWVIENPLSNDEYIYFKLNDPNTIKSNVPTTMVVNVLTDKLKISSYAKETSTKSNSYFQAWISHFIGISRTELSTQDAVGFKEWLSNNNIPIQYPLSEKSIKTVDLTVVDQDGNTVPHLQAFNETTHISTSSTGLIPNVVIPATVSYPSIIKPSTLYTVKLKRSVTSGTLMINVGGTEQAVTSDCFTITTPSTLTSQDVIFSGKGNVISEVTVAEGDQTSKEYGYFEGMQSVKMPVLTTTGKNLFSPTKMIINDGATYGYYKYKDDESVRCTLSISDKDTSVDISGIYFGMSKSGKNANDGIEWLISNGSVTQPNKLSFTTNRNFISIYPNNTETLNKLTKRFNIQLEYGEVKTTYEPYKSNILSTPSDLELRGIGQGSNRVEDELDLLTGEVTERIGEIVLDGSEDEVWTESRQIEINGVAYEQYYLTSLVIPSNNYMGATAVPTLLCDKGVTDPFNGLWMGGSIKTISLRELNGKYRLCMNFPLNENIKLWLQQNHMTLCYQLEKESIKTVDLTVVDQDNQPTQLGTFENVTNVSLEAENLIPEVEMEVATNLLEDTVFNLTNAFNTLYPTAAKPVKSAILSGNTLKEITNNLFDGEVEDGDYDINTGEKRNYSNRKRCANKIKINPSTTYTLSGITWYLQYDENGDYLGYAGANDKRLVFTSKNNARYLTFYSVNNESDFFVGLGDTEPLYELVSVKMPVLTTTGKNLFNIPMSNESDFLPNTAAYRTSETIQLKPNTNYTLSAVTKDYIGRLKVLAVGDGSVWVDPPQTTRIFIRTDHNTTGMRTYTFTTTETGLFNLWYYDEDKQYNVSDFLESIQLEEGSVATSYEPHKSNILSTPSDLELRGVGEGSSRVEDELDCLTGEVTQRIDEYSFNGSENWLKRNNGDGVNTISFHIDLPKTNANTNNFINNIFNFSGSSTSGVEGCAFSGTLLIVQINRSRLDTVDLEGFRKWLQTSNFKVQVPLKENVVKTVDLTVVDQDGNETKLGTFDDTTHALLNSEGLIPTAVLTVRTKIPSGSSTSLLMDDISTEQQQLETTVDKQSENVDATMIATTEIFEETL